MTTQKERFKPKWENLQHLLALGVIPYTVWNFEGKQECQTCHRKVAIIYLHSCGLDICCECWRSKGCSQSVMRMAWPLVLMQGKSSDKSEVDAIDIE